MRGLCLCLMASSLVGAAFAGVYDIQKGSKIDGAQIRMVSRWTTNEIAFAPLTNMAAQASTTSTSAESNRATTVETSLSNQIVAVSNSAALVSGSISNQVVAESNRASWVEANVSNQIVALSNSCALVDGSLSNQVVAESNRASWVETYMSNQIVSVSNTCALVDGSVSNQVVAESNRAAWVETFLSNEFTTAIGGVSNMVIIESNRASWTEGTLSNTIVAVSGTYSGITHSLSNQILAESNRASVVEASLSNQTVAVSNQVSALSNTMAWIDGSISNQIVSESNRASWVETSLSNQIGSVSNQLAALSNTMAVVDTSISNQVIALSNRTSWVDGSISNQIVAESNRASLVEISLSNQILAISNLLQVVQIEVESNRASWVETSLSNQIIAVSNTCALVDTSLSNQIIEVSNTCAGVDGSLSNQIVAESNRASWVEGRLSNMVVGASNHAAYATQSGEAQGANWAWQAEYATNAERAAGADWAWQSEYATNAQDAAHASSADEATHASSADEATHASSADEATHAASADEATHAASATGADWAWQTEYATNAETAASATSASYLNQWQSGDGAGTWYATDITNEAVKDAALRDNMRLALTGGQIEGTVSVATNRNAKLIKLTATQLPWEVTQYDVTGDAYYVQGGSTYYFTGRYTKMEGVIQNGQPVYRRDFPSYLFYHVTNRWQISIISYADVPAGWRNNGTNATDNPYTPAYEAVPKYFGSCAVRAVESNNPIVITTAAYSTVSLSDVTNVATTVAANDQTALRRYGGTTYGPIIIGGTTTIAKIIEPFLIGTNADVLDVSGQITSGYDWFTGLYYRASENMYTGLFRGSYGYDQVYVSNATGWIETRSFIGQWTFWTNNLNALTGHYREVGGSTTGYVNYYVAYTRLTTNELANITDTTNAIKTVEVNQTAALSRHRDSSTVLHGTNASAALDGVAIGSNATVLTGGGIAIGKNAKAYDNVAIGAGALATTIGATLIGKNTYAEINCTAVGETAYAGNDSVAVGVGSIGIFQGVSVGTSANTSRGVAVGYAAFADTSVAIGYGVTNRTWYTLAIPNGVPVEPYHALTLGQHAELSPVAINVYFTNVLHGYDGGTLLTNMVVWPWLWASISNGFTWSASTITVKDSAWYDVHGTISWDNDNDAEDLFVFVCTNRVMLIQTYTHNLTWGNASMATTFNGMAYLQSNSVVTVEIKCRDLTSVSEASFCINKQ